MLPKNVPTKLQEITFNEFVELADVKPSRVRHWQGRDLLPIRERDSFTLGDAILAAAIDAMESLELPPQFAKPTVPHIFYYLVRARPSVVRIASANYGTAEQRASATSSLRSLWLDDVMDMRPKRYAAIYESIYMRIVTKRFVKKVEYSFDYDIVDLHGIATAMAARATRPLVELRVLNRTRPRLVEIEQRAG